MPIVYSTLESHSDDLEWAISPQSPSAKDSDAKSDYMDIRTPYPSWVKKIAATYKTFKINEEDLQLGLVPSWNPKKASAIQIDLADGERIYVQLITSYLQEWNATRKKNYDWRNPPPGRKPRGNEPLLPTLIVKVHHYGESRDAGKKGKVRPAIPFNPIHDI